MKRKEAIFDQSVKKAQNEKIMFQDQIQTLKEELEKEKNGVQLLK